MTDTNRRTFLKTVGATTAAAGLAGCMDVLRGVALPDGYEENLELTGERQKEALQHAGYERFLDIDSLEAKGDFARNPSLDDRLDIASYIETQPGSKYEDTYDYTGHRGDPGETIKRELGPALAIMLRETLFVYKDEESPGVNKEAYGDVIAEMGYAVIGQRGGGIRVMLDSDEVEHAESLYDAHGYTEELGQELYEFVHPRITGPDWT